MFLQKKEHIFTLKKEISELIYRAETDLQILETNLYLPKGKYVNLEFGINTNTPLWTKQVHNEGLLYDTGHSTHYSGITSDKRI